MRLMKFMSATAIVISITSSICYAEEVEIKTLSGETITIDIQEHETFTEVMQRVGSQLGNEANASKPRLLIDYKLSTSDIAGHRDYDAQVTASEKEDIVYIITTLATASWPSLLIKESSLNRAGDRIDHLHPFRFLRCILNNVDLNSCLHVIRDRSKVWPKFYKGLAETLQEEYDGDNLSEECIRDFAKCVKVDAKHIIKAVESCDWHRLITDLMEHIPRGGDTDRYDI